MKRNVLSEIVERIEDPLKKIGILYRVYSRSKSPHSISNKIYKAEKKGEPYGDKKKMQDIFGIRVVLYFVDDIKIVHEILSSIFEERVDDSKTNDLDEEKYKDTFKPVRYNLIYKIPSEIGFDVSSFIDNPEFINKIDSTFEVQIRTTLSEGWYEVEHDLRYKNEKDWIGHNEEWRQLNGVLASLETNDWAILQIFKSLAYKHYRNHNWQAMLNLKFRIRIDQSKPLSKSITNILDEEGELAKKIFKINRNDILMKMSQSGFYYPLLWDNLLYFINMSCDEMKNKKILEKTPTIMLEEMS